MAFGETIKIQKDVDFRLDDCYILLQAQDNPTLLQCKMKASDAVVLKPSFSCFAVKSGSFPCAVMSNPAY